MTGKVQAAVDTGGRRRFRDVEVLDHVIIIPVCGNAKAGATAGWVVTGGTDKLHATLPASQTNSTLVIPVSDLNLGDTITAFTVNGQVESAGATATLTTALRKQTNAAADNTDASVSSVASGNLTADAIIAQGASSLTEVVASGVAYYILLTGTTAALTDLDITHATVTVKRAA